MTAGTYGTTYATVSFQEYFAEGVQDFFDVNVMGKRFVPIWQTATHPLLFINNLWRNLPR